MTFSPHGNLTKSLLLATDTYNSQGKKERKKKKDNKGENYARQFTSSK